MNKERENFPVKKISIIVVVMSLFVALLAGCSQPATNGTISGSANGSSGSAGFAASGFIGSSGFLPEGSGFMDEKEVIVPEFEEPKYKTIGTVVQGPLVKKTLLMNLTGKDIIGIAIKSSDEPTFGNKLLMEGDLFVLDEIRQLFFDLSPEKKPETEMTTAAESQTTTIADNSKPTNGSAAPTQAPETPTAPEAAVADNKKYDAQITFSDWTVYVIHDLPFDDMKLGRLMLQNDILFLEYTSEETGEEVITRKKEYDIKAAEWQVYQEQLAQQQAWQQQQQQQYVAPATNNDAGCIGDAGLMW